MAGSDTGELFHGLKASELAAGLVARRQGLQILDAADALAAANAGEETTLALGNLMTTMTGYDLLAEVRLVGALMQKAHDVQRPEEPDGEIVEEVYNPWREKPPESENWLALGDAIDHDIEDFVARFHTPTVTSEDGVTRVNPEYQRATGDLYHRLFYRQGEAFHLGVDEGLDLVNQAARTYFGHDPDALAQVNRMIEGVRHRNDINDTLRALGRIGRHQDG